MEVVKVKPSGYCKGVINAINLVKRAVSLYPNSQIYILGMLVHNKYIVEAFKKLNVITLDDKNKSKEALIDEIKEGVIVFTAHGIDPKLKMKAKQKGLIVIDATCSDVNSNTELCLKYLNEGYHIVYIGKKGHPESEAILSLSNKIHLVTNLDDIEQLNISDKILVTNQTTMSILDIAYLIEKIQKKFPDAIIAQEICNATRSRQSALLNLQGFDCLVVVGDPNSNNTTQLSNIGCKSVKMVIKVENAKQLLAYDFTNISKVAVTAGASTPSYLTDQVIAYLKTSDEQYLDIDITKILD